MPAAPTGSPFDGVMMEYVNPVTNGPVMQTLGACMQMLRPGEHTKAHRHTGSYLYHVAKGSGHSIINGKRFDWNERDIFCVPVLGLARTCERIGPRGRVPVLPERPAGDAGAGPLPRTGLWRKRRPSAASVRNTA